MQNKIIYSPKYEIDLGAHPFDTTKYRITKEALLKEGIFKESDFIAPEAGSREDIELVHTHEYFNGVDTLTLPYQEVLRLEIPLTGEIADAGKIACGGTILAVEIALEHGTGIHMGGGWHHAFSDHGEGFCVFNDMAVAVKKIMKEGKIKKPIIVDCDLHQGNGTAYIFKDDVRIFTFSIHEEGIYPFPKQKSDLDINLPAGTTDEPYLDLLGKGLKSSMGKHKPDFLMYQAGADPYMHDQLGNLKLSINGLIERDKIVLNQAKEYGIPSVVTFGGGYAVDVNDTATIHRNTVMVFWKTWNK